MSEGISDTPPLHCSHCGRAVAQTMHTRTAYRVDYYSLYTGDGEEKTIQLGADHAVTVLRLLTRRDIITCVDCYREPQVRAAREALFRPEEEAGSIEPCAAG